MRLVTLNICTNWRLTMADKKEPSFVELMVGDGPLVEPTEPSEWWWEGVREELDKLKRSIQ